jgi:hypothetical protein
MGADPLVILVTNYCVYRYFHTYVKGDVILRFGDVIKNSNGTPSVCLGFRNSASATRIRTWILLADINFSKVSCTQMASAHFADIQYVDNQNWLTQCQATLREYSNISKDTVLCGAAPWVCITSNEDITVPRNCHVYTIGAVDTGNIGTAPTAGLDLMDPRTADLASEGVYMDILRRIYNLKSANTRSTRIMLISDFSPNSEFVLTSLLVDTAALLGYDRTTVCVTLY